VSAAVVVRAAVVVAAVVSALVPVPALFPDLQPARERTHTAPIAAAAIFIDFIITPQSLISEVIIPL
jgi:hypothetical protein